MHQFLSLHGDTSPKILGPTPFVALNKKKKNLAYYINQISFPFVSKKAQLNSSLLTQDNNQKLTGPQLPGMMSQNL